MTTTKSEIRQRSKNIIEMKRTYEASEWLLEGRISDVGYLVFKLYREAVKLGVERAYFEEYMRKKIIKLLDESFNQHISENRGKG